MSRPTPTSTRSEWARAARRLANKSFRDRVSRFLVEGPQAVRELVAWRPESVSEVVLSDEATGVALAVAAQARAAGCKVTEVPEQVLVSITDTVTPQGIAAVAGYLDSPVELLLDSPVESAQGSGGAPWLGVLLSDVRDPGNAGTVLRTADAAGAQAVLFGEGSVDPYNGKCVRSSAGSIFHTGFSRNTSVLEAIKLAKAAGLTVLATSLQADLILGTRAANEVLSEPTLWVFGSEAHGLPHETVSQADHSLRIPIRGEAESLNLASAAAVCLYASAFARA